MRRAEREKEEGAKASLLLVSLFLFSFLECLSVPFRESENESE